MSLSGPLHSDPQLSALLEAEEDRRDAQEREERIREYCELDRELELSEFVGERIRRGYRSVGERTR